MVFENIGFFIGAIALMILSGSFVVKALTKISVFLRISEFAAAFVIMAVSTSLPELFVAITASIANEPSIILGTIIGSNIANLTLVAGLTILVSRGITIKSKETAKDSYMMIAFAALPLVLMVIGNVISRFDGIILLVAFVLYNWHVIKRSRQYSKEFEEKVNRWEILGWFSVFAVSFIGLYFGANWTVTYASLLAVEFALPAIFIGLVIIALGTSLPELVFGIQSTIAGKGDLVVGNLIGSVIANSTLIFGVAAIIRPITNNFAIFFTSAIFMLIVAFIFSVFAETKDRITWKEGLVLVFLYIFFLIVELSSKGFAL